MPTKGTKSLRLEDSPSPGDSDTDTMSSIISSIIRKPRKTKPSRLEKSKVAAKSRRDQETMEFSNLTELLPMSKHNLEKLDKASIVRALVSYMAVKTFVQREMALIVKDTRNGRKAVAMDVNDSSPEANNKVMPVTKTNGQHCIANTIPEGIEENSLMLSALNAFLMVLDRKKNIVFVSDNVVDFLGLSQTKMIGNSIKDFLHPNDIPEMKKQFNLQVSTDDTSYLPMADEELMPRLEDKRLFYVRMKFNITKPGQRSRHSGFTLVQWSGRIKMKKSVLQPPGHTIECLVCICRPMQSTSILEIRMDGNMFMSRHDLGMRFTFCDTRIVTLIGYEPSELVGRTAYQFHNPLDAETVGKCHSNLIVKGTSVSKYYRFLGKNCDWVWMQTRATIIYNTKNVPQYIVCMNYIISEEEGQRYIMMAEDQQGKLAVCAPGVMDLSDITTLATCDDPLKGDHSDGGYHSGNSPYSSINPSPSEVNMNDENNITLTETDDDFPPGVFQEVNNTINPSHESIFDIISSLGKETGQPCNKRSDHSPLSVAGSWMDPQADMATMCPPSTAGASYIADTSIEMMTSPGQKTMTFQTLISCTRHNTSVASSVLQTQMYSPQGSMAGVEMSLPSNCDMLSPRSDDSYSSLSPQASAHHLLSLDDSSRSSSVCSGFVSSSGITKDGNINMLSPIPATSSQQNQLNLQSVSVASPQQNLINLQPISVSLSPQQNLINLQPMSVPPSPQQNQINLQPMSVPSSPQQNQINLQPMSVPSSPQQNQINLQPVSFPPSPQQNQINLQPVSFPPSPQQNLISLQPMSVPPSPQQNLINLQPMSVPSSPQQNLINLQPISVPSSPQQSLLDVQPTSPQDMLNIQSIPAQPSICSLQQIPVTSSDESLLDLPSSVTVTTTSSAVNSMNQQASPSCSAEMMNLSISMPADSDRSDTAVSAGSDSLPPEISDLWLQFCSTMTDNQVQQVLDEFRREEVLSSIQERRNCQQSMVTPVQGIPNINGISCTTAGVGYLGGQNYTTAGPTLLQGCITTPTCNGTEHYPASTVPKQHRAELPNQDNKFMPMSNMSCVNCSSSQNGQYRCVQHKNDSEPNNHVLLGSDINTTITTMSELEKMLRGYSCNGQCDNFCESRSNGQSDLDMGGSTLLKQMLTGHLSGECYHAMEKQRQATTNSPHE